MSNSMKTQCDSITSTSTIPHETRNYKTQAKFNFSSVYKATTLLQQLKDIKVKLK